uniref:Methyltransferase-like protein 5 n=1 Tax=Auxenochlorella protothecoides TaxID=3075 RepID=A0A1D1ZTQ7_AUXPR
MKLKELESLMQEVSPFLQPKVELEQYPTGAHLASRLLYTVANSYGEFEGKVVADLGCGTGMLAIGAAALGAGQVLAFDLDQDALETAQENVRGIFGDSDDEADDDGAAQIEFVRSDVRLLAEQQPRLHVDTVIMNPPFGTRQKGVDMDFLRAAAGIAGTSVYSLHKTSTRDFIQKFAVKTLGLATGAATVVAQLRYDLPPTYAFHRLKSKDIEVDLWRFQMS